MYIYIITYSSLVTEHIKYYESNGRSRSTTPQKKINFKEN